jgi:sensor histidine kinase YesM
MMVREQETPTVWRIALSALRTAPAHVRRGITVMLIASALALTLQFSADFTPGEPKELVELLSVILGSGGAFLFGLVYLLHHVSQRVAACDVGLIRTPVEVTTFNVILVAVPVLSFVSGCMLAAATGILISRALLDSWILFIPAAVNLVLLLLVARYVGHTTRFLYRHGRDQAELAARAREEATESQLAALQAQMNPHFLFNSLNTVAALVRSDPVAAERTVENLAAVLRRTLDRSGRSMSTVRDEIEFLRAYLAVEQERWRSRLTVEMHVDNAALDCAIPTMTLQPLVENSLKYAIGSRLEGGRLRVSAQRLNGEVRLSVADDGPGFPARYREGTGLGNLRRRLVTLYGDTASLELQRNNGGAEVRISVPVRQGAGQ